MKQIHTTPPSIGIAELLEVSENAAAVVSQVRASMLAPEARKSPPRFNSAQLAELCGIEKTRLQYLAKKGELPSGNQEGASRREWTLVEAREWVRTIKSESLRDPTVAAGAVITIANFKGGVSKTTTAAAIAQGLSLRGHRVLVIDTDPQGSLTTLFGVLPDTDVDEEQTILPLCAGDVDSVMPAIQRTYWDGIDLVAAAPVLFNAEFLLPSRQKSEKGFAFWRVLDEGLVQARDEYDVIIIDTPPSLSYITINALIAADGVIMPLPPNALDFASSAQFWNLFTEVCGGLFKAGGDDKKFSFVDVVLSRVDRADAVSAAVRQWIVSAYGSKVLPIEIPKTSIAASASAEFGTVYDVDSSSVQAKTLKRARDAYDQLVDHIEMQVTGVWAHSAEVVRSVLQKT
jgi:chromosome partitioning protein